MSIDLNQAPYWDDFDKFKGYHRILFRPGVAVQARELTQLQTILQNQISVFGEHIFKSGSLVKGGAFHINNDADYIKIETDLLSFTDNINFYIGKEIESVDTGVKATITNVFYENDDMSFFLKYTHGSSVYIDIKEFRIGETVTITGSSILMKISPTDNAVGKGSLFSIDEGVIFSVGHFIQFPSSSIVVDPFSTTPTNDVGFIIHEGIVTSSDDSSLLDNARGSFNFAAPGAHRLQYKLGLALKDIDIEDERFIFLYRIVNGTVTLKFNKPQYADILDEFATRTYEKSGHFVTSPFTIAVKEHLKIEKNQYSDENGGFYDIQQGGDAQKLLIEVSSGNAYVKGYRVEKLESNRVNMSKSLQTKFINDQFFSVNIGNFVIVNEVCGPWSASEGSGEVLLRSSTSRAITLSTYSSTNNTSTVIGRAKFYSIRHHQNNVGAASTQYKIYLYDIKMDVGRIFGDTRSLEMTSNPKAFADIVLTEGSAQLFDRDVFPHIYKLPKSHILTMRDEGGNGIDTSFEFKKIFNVTFSGTPRKAIVTISDGNESFLFGLGSLSESERNEILVISTSLNSGRVFPVLGASQTGMDTVELDIGNTTVTTAKVLIRVRRSTARESSKIVRRNAFIRIDCDTAGTSGPFNMGVTDIFRINGIYKGSGNYSVNNEDVKSMFTLDNGQRDSLYDHGRITPKKNFLTSNDRLLVSFDYFEHNYDNGIGYFSVDSYPVNDQPTNDIEYETTIRTWEIPVYKDLMLRDCVDVRRSKVFTATNLLNASTCTINPATTESMFSHPQRGVYHLSPDRLFKSDLHYYIGRYVVLALDKNGQFVLVEGNYSEYPVAPEVNKDLMHISTMLVKPYPSLSPTFAQRIGKRDDGILINNANNRRYTESDLRKVDQRLNNIEYYTSLTLLESKTKDLLILDSNDQNRFKNGFFVDPFTDHNIGDYKRVGYHCSIDPTKGVLAPSTIIHHISMKYSPTETTGTNRNS
jgi:hypothetical protein